MPIHGRSQPFARPPARPIDAVPASGVVYTKSGAVVLDGLVLSGPDVSEHVETGQVTLGNLILSGADASEHVETGSVVLGLVASGVDSEAVTSTKTGMVVLGLALSGPDVSTHARTGAVALGLAASGARVGGTTTAAPAAWSPFVDGRGDAYIYEGYKHMPTPMRNSLRRKR